jgi:hypothetical protein
MSRTRKTTEAQVNGNDVDAEILEALDGGSAARETKTESAPSDASTSQTPGERQKRKYTKREKVRINLELNDPQLVQLIADAPYTAAVILGAHPKIRRAFSPPEKFLENGRKCMSKYLESLQVSIHPMVAYGAITVAGLGMMFVTSQRLTDEQFNAMRNAMRGAPPNGTGKPPEQPSSTSTNADNPPGPGSSATATA